MRRLIATVLLSCSITLLGFAQSTTKYTTGTILDVVELKDAPGATGAKPVFHVSVRVKDTVYVVRYLAPLRGDGTKYVAGMQLPVLVGEETIKFNDLAGQSFEVPIVKKMPAPRANASK